MDLIGAYSDSDSEEEQPELEPEEPEVKKVKPKVKLPPPDLTTASTRADEVKKVIYRSQVEYLLSFSKITVLSVGLRLCQQLRSRRASSAQSFG